MYLHPPSKFKIYNMTAGTCIRAATLLGLWYTGKVIRYLDDYREKKTTQKNEQRNKINHISGADPEIFQREGVEEENFGRKLFVDTRINACTHKN